LALQPIVVVFS